MPKQVVEYVGNASIRDQMLIAMGYVGPNFGGVGQYVITHPITEAHVVDVGDVQPAFREYFSEKTGLTVPDGVVAGGGCSGALFSTLVADSSRTKTLILRPFFTPQRGIAEGAGQDVALQDSVEDLIAAMEANPRANVLVTAPENPTGDILSEENMAKIVDAARRTGARLVLDLTYFNRVNREYRAAFKAMLAVASTAPEYVMIASGSKSLALTKYRPVFVTGTEPTFELVREWLEPLDVVAAKATEVALRPEIRDIHANQMDAYFEKNEAAIRGIIAEPRRKVPHLHEGLQRFQAVVEAFNENYPGCLAFKPGSGALYGIFSVTGAEAQIEFHRLIQAENLALVPGEVFMGNPCNVADVEKTPQETYRVSLMANPAV